MENIEDNKKRKKKLIITIAVVLIAIIGITYAYFRIRKETEIFSATTGGFNINFTTNSTVSLTNAYPLQEDEIEDNSYKNTFTLSNTGSQTVYAKLDLTNIVLSSAFQTSPYDLKWDLFEGDSRINYGSFAVLDNGKTNILRRIVLPANSSKQYKLRIWIEETPNDQNSLQGGTLTGKITASATAKSLEYVDNSGANPPELATGMIPVTYDESTDNWVKADVSQKWYDYDKQMWANAVTVTSTNRSTYMSADAGTAIPMTDINTMWVWIPRYKYKIPNSIGSSTDVTSPPEIDVVFETDYATTGVSETVYRSGMSTTNTNYYTHPAFRDGSKVYNETPYDIGGWDKELTGMWVGKFEPGGNATTPTIKPDIISLRTQHVSTQFTTSLKLAGGTMDSTTGKVTFYGNSNYGLTKDTDTHMMKNTEWGMVAILSQSKYGKMGNSDYTGANKEVYINNSKLYYTGRSGGGPGGSTPINGTYTDQSSTTQYNDYGFYTYNDYLLNYNTNTKGNKVKGKGTGASTTGTIYGVYDMSGGASEYTFGNWNGTTSSSGFTIFPENKYYDKYTKGTSSTTITKEKAILGDATWETAKWYKDYADFPYADYPFSRRGGSYSNTTDAGVFFSNYYYGRANTYNSFRFALIP